MPMTIVVAAAAAAVAAVAAAVAAAAAAAAAVEGDEGENFCDLRPWPPPLPLGFLLKVGWLSELNDRHAPR